MPTPNNNNLRQLRSDRHQLNFLSKKLERMSTDNLSSEDLTRYENLLSVTENQLKDLDNAISANKEVFQAAFKERKISAAISTANEIMNIIDSSKSSVDNIIIRKLVTKSNYIRSVVGDSSLVLSENTLGSLNNVLRIADDFISQQ